MLPNLLLRNSAIGEDKNLCFTNAAIQILRNIPLFKIKCRENSGFSNLHAHLEQLLQFEGKDKSISAHSVRKCLGQMIANQELYSGQQNDALEFCEYLLQKLHPTISLLFRFKTLIKKEFFINGDFSNCLKCGKAPNDKFDEHLVLKLSFPTSLYLYSNGVELQQLINKRFAESFTEQTNGMRCEYCCNHDSNVQHNQDCEPKPFKAQEHLIKHPQYLILQLLRFQQTPNGLQKVNIKVTNPFSIVIQQTEYELISVLNHEGGYENGHYTALLKSDHWYLCDDIRNSVIDNNAVVTEKNYAYIFKKKEPIILEPEHEEFILTDEWQFVPPGVKIPGGCHVEFDMETGFTKAKRLNKENNTEKGTHKSRYSNSNVDNTKSLPSQNYAPSHKYPPTNKYLSSQKYPSSHNYPPSNKNPPSQKNPYSQRYPPSPRYANSLSSPTSLDSLNYCTTPPTCASPPADDSPTSFNFSPSCDSPSSAFTPAHTGPTYSFSPPGKITFDVKLDENQPVQVEILDLASNMLHKENKRNKLFGSISPSLVLNHASTSKLLPNLLCVPKNANGINIHLLKNKDNHHYVVSYKLVIDSQSIFKIYDSLPAGKKVWQQRLKNLPMQLRMIYGDIPQNTSDIEVICAQNQGYHTKQKNNSGLFALANFLMLSHSKDPCHFKLAKNMRGQLKNMLSGPFFKLHLFSSIPLSPANQSLNNIPLKKKLTVNLKRLGDDQISFVNCSNRFSILTQLQDNSNNFKKLKENQNKKRKRKEIYETREKVNEKLREKDRLSKKLKYEKEGKVMKKTGMKVGRG